jgi:hypothetical protein
MQPFLVDPSGNIKVNVAAGGAAGGTSSTFGAAFPGPGTAVGAKDASTGFMQGLNVDPSGNLKVNIAVGSGGGTSSTFGAAFPIAGLGTAIGAYDGTNMQPLRVDATALHNLLVRQSDGSNVATIKAGAAGATQSDTAVVDRNPDVGTITDAIYGGSGNTTVIGALKGVYAAATSSIPAGSNTIGNVGISGAVPGASNSVSFGSDPCTYLQKTNQPLTFTSTSSATLTILAAIPAKRVFVCSIVLMFSAATTFSLAEGQGTTCAAPNQAGMIGVGTNVAVGSGMSFPASGGMTLGNGTGTVTQTANINTNICFYNTSSGSTTIAGNMTYVAN